MDAEACTGAQLLAEVDVLVIGGGFSGVAAACAAKDDGCSVAVIEPRTYLGEELSASYRMWLSSLEKESVQTVFGRNPWWVDPATNGCFNRNEYAIQPDLMKICLEDELLKRDIRFLYQVRPVKWQKHHQDGPFHIQVLGKFGSGVITASSVIDASVQGDFVRLVDGTKRRYEGKSVPVARTLEFIRVQADLLDSCRLTLPHGIPGRIEIHKGHDDDGHVLVSYEFEWAVKEGPLGRNDVEIHAQKVSRELAKWLIQNQPAFAAARWVGSAQECWIPPLYQCGVSHDIEDRSDLEGTLTAAYQLTDGVWVANGIARVDDERSQEMASDIGQLLSIGSVIGRLCRKKISNSQLPISIAPIREVREVDVLVVGGGTSGVPAAVAAAELGCRTLLMEMNSALGGTGTLGGVDSYWYGRRGGFNARVTQAVAAEHRWMGVPAHQAKWNLEAKKFAWLNLAQNAGVDIVLHAFLADVIVDDKGKVTGALISTRDGYVEVRSSVVIDATGDGDVVVRAGGAYVYGSERDGATMWYSMIPFTKPGLSKNNWTSMVDVDDAADMTRAIVSARRRWIGHDHGAYMAPRETRHIQGEVCLTLTQQLQQKQWEDVINIAYSNHDIKGQSTSDWIRMGLIPPNLEIEIPYRALIPKMVDGVIVTGKSISATHDALPAIRMQADLENLGAVCGVAAAMCVASHMVPRQVSIPGLQRRLVEKELLPETILHRAIEDTSMTEEVMSHWIEQLDDSVRLYDYSDMGVGDVRREPIPIVMVCTAGPGIVPLLRAELARGNSPRRATVAKALAWYADSAAVDTILAEIEPYLSADELPMRDSKIRNTQASPDQGAMPDLAYLLHTLAMVRDERAIAILERSARKLDASMEKFTNRRSGIFHYVDALCDIAEQLGDPRCVPALEYLHSLPLFQNRYFSGMCQSDYFEERLAYLEVLIGRSLARCGSRKGLEMLASYLNDSRRALARHAYQELKDISGEEYPLDTAIWLRWIGQTEQFAPKPWIAERGGT